MPVHKLTIQFTQAAALLNGKDTIYRDTEVTGFSLKVTPANNRIFFFQYHTNGSKLKTNRIKIGKFPAIKPDEARNIAIQYSAALARKEDPAKKLKAASETRQREILNSFENVFNVYAEKRLSQNRSGNEVKRAFTRDFMPTLRAMAITDISRSDISKIIDNVFDRDAPYASNRALSFIKTFFRWALSQGYIQGDPTSGMQRPFKGEMSRDRVLTPDEIKILWAEFGNLNFPFEHALKMLMMTAQRREEVGSITWESLDRTTGLWSIAREVTKNKQPHQIPLPYQCIDLLCGGSGNDDQSEKRTGFIFTTTGETAISGWSKAKRRIIDGLNEKCLEIADWRFHDFRRTVSSALGDMGYRDQDIAMLLNHQSRGVTAVYNRSQYLALKEEMLSKWNSRLQEIISDE